jgi:hypothetical protein
MIKAHKIRLNTTAEQAHSFAKEALRLSVSSQ